MNKKEKKYFIDCLLRNHHNYSHDNKLEYNMNYDIVYMFKELGHIGEELYHKLIALIYEASYEDMNGAIVEALKLLYEEFHIKVNF